MGKGGGQGWQWGPQGVAAQAEGVDRRGGVLEVLRRGVHLRRQGGGPRLEQLREVGRVTADVSPAPQHTWTCEDT